MKNTKSDNEMNRGSGGAALVVCLREKFSFGDRFVKELAEEMKTFDSYRTSEECRYVHSLIDRALGFNVRYRRQTLPFWQVLAAFGDPRTVLALREINETIRWTNHMTSSSDYSDSDCYEQSLACHHKIWNGFAQIRQHLLRIALMRRAVISITEDLGVWGVK